MALEIDRYQVIWSISPVLLVPRDFSDIQVEVTWRPRDGSLHYQALYRGIWEYLRAPPSNHRKMDAWRYLAELTSGYKRWATPLQRDRIRWTRAWLKMLEDEDSGAETDERDSGDTAGI